jgi:hypothetical protein
MVTRLRINTRKAAVHLGETLMHRYEAAHTRRLYTRIHACHTTLPKAPPNRGIIEHVSNSEPFLDSKTSYYRFRPVRTAGLSAPAPPPTGSTDCVLFPCAHRRRRDKSTCGIPTKRCVRAMRDVRVCVRVRWCVRLAFYSAYICVAIAR